jgi:hypothetical protein
MSEPHTEHRPRLTLDIYSGDDRVGTLKVGQHQDDVGAFWWWEFGNGNGQLLDKGDNLEMAGPQTPSEAMRVLILVLLATADNSLDAFTDAGNEWARMHSKALTKTLDDV